MLKPYRLATRYCVNCGPSVLQSLVSSLVLSRLDYRNATLVGVSSHLLLRLQLVMNAAARLIFSSSKFQHITQLLRHLHWLKAPERIAFQYAVLVHKCLHGSAPAYHTDAERHNLRLSVVRETWDRIPVSCKTIQQNVTSL